MNVKINKLKMFFFLVICLGITASTFAQRGIVQGIVSDTNEELIGASVGVRGTGIGTVTNFEGFYSLSLNPGTYTLDVSYIGYGTQSQDITITADGTTTADFTLAEGISFDEIVVTGTRASNRTNVDAPVPIDVINVKKLSIAAPQTSINQLLHTSAPSFSSNTQTISDGTDHIDPASLRGLGPDQVLVLINGKRRHTSSLVNVNGTFGRGSVGTDLNAIPASAVKVIEVLRDGAAAQYGSDAIAGVINVRLNDNVNELTANVTTGANFTKNIGPFGGETKSADGEVFNLGLNYGLPLGEKGGYINFTGEVNLRGATNRMQEYSGSVFSGYNSIERVARERGMNVSELTNADYASLATDIDFFSQAETDWMTNNTDHLNGANASDVMSSLASANNLDYGDANDLAALMALVSDITYLTSDQMSDINTLNLDGTTAVEQLEEFKGNLGGVSTPLARNATDYELGKRNQTRADYNMRVGQSKLRGGKFFMNMAMPLGDKLEFYSFGGIGYRDGNSGCFYRLPNQSRTTTAIYADGTVPNINSNIKDKSLAAGIRGTVGDWDIDFSNVYGENSFFYHMTQAHNATLGAGSPTDFDSGGHSFAQNTSNVDLSQYFDNVGGMPGINVAFGGEYRYENYKEVAGSELSWGNYDVNGNLVTLTTSSDLLVKDIIGRNRPSGCQCFAGFLPSNEVDANRSSVGAYLDLEADITKSFLFGGAIRYENYSDFGSTFNFKGAARLKVTDNIAIRTAASTGFRAPSLHQIHFSRTSTIFELVNGVSVAQEQGTFANTSQAAKLLGIPELKEERSQNYSFGVTAKLPSTGLKITVDAYKVDIQDRVILTGSFKASDVSDPVEKAKFESILKQAGATTATFFANAIDTESVGLDIVIAHRMIIGENNLLTNSLAGTFTDTKWVQDPSDLDSDDTRVLVGGIKASQQLVDAGLVNTYFDQTSRIYLEEAVPRVKLTLSNTLDLGKLSIYLRNTYFGQTTEATSAALFDADLNLLSDATVDPYNDPKVITDLSFGYKFTDALGVTIGANNLLDVYPDEVDPLFNSSQRFVFSRRSPQFSFGGRFLFARINFTLK